MMLGYLDMVYPPATTASSSDWSTLPASFFGDASMRADRDPVPFSLTIGPVRSGGYASQVAGSLLVLLHRPVHRVRPRDRPA